MGELEQSGPMQTCWIENFVEQMKGSPSPEIFLKWSAIVTVGAAIGRRVWSTTAESPVFPNLFVLLVAPPGVGKTIGIRKSIELSNKAGKIKLAPDDTTKASLLDAMEASMETEVISPVKILIHHSMFLGLDELGTMLSAHDLSIMSVMNALFDNRDVYKESRRGRENDMILTNPQLTMLAGTQPDFLAGMLPPEAWGMGFMSRMIMVYHGKPVKVKLFGVKAKPNLDKMGEQLTAITNLYGEMTWEEEAQDLITEWYEAGLQPVPQHTKLKHYNSRRILHVLKLAMISSISRSPYMIVEKADVQRALNWLVEVEQLMPEIFKDMSGKSDILIIQDLSSFLWSQYYQDGGKVVFHRSVMEMFLAARTPAYNVENIIKLCVGAKIVVDKGADMFVVGNNSELGEA